MNVITLANAGLSGFLVSLLVLECLRPIVGAHWPEQRQGLQMENRVLPWAIAVLAGPALLWDQSRAYRSRRVGSLADLGVIVVLIAVWSASYGVSLSLVMRTFF